VGTAAAGGSLSLSFKDCGAKHSVTKDVQPTTLELGANTAITGTGSLDKEVSGGTYDMELKAGGGLIDSHFTGKNCEAKDFTLPLGLGTLSWDGISCPLAAADSVAIGFHTKLASSLPAALATSDIHLASQDQDGESVLCVDLHLAKQQLGEEVGDHGQVFLEGFLEGFLGECEHLKACISESAKAAKDARALVADLKSKNFNKTIADVQALVGDVMADLKACKDAPKDLAPLLAAFKGVHSIKDLMKKFEDNFLAHDKQILDVMEDMIDVCTISKPDAKQCGVDAGKELRSLVVGDKVSAQLEDHGKVFFQGFLEGFLGDSEHIKACVSESVKAAQDVGNLLSDLKSRNFNKTVADVEALVTDISADVKACKDVGKDLQELMAAFKDVHSIKDLMNALKEHFLAHDREVLDVLEDMIEVCTISKPDAKQCGVDAGKEVRSILVGDSVVV